MEIHITMDEEVQFRGAHFAKIAKKIKSFLPCCETANIKILFAH